MLQPRNFSLFLAYMKILDKYITRRFWFFFTAAIIAFVLVFLIVDLVENLDHYIDRNATAKDVVLYYVYYIPYIVLLVTPIGMLLAASFVGGYLVKHRGIIAIRSSGISSFRIAGIMMVWGLLISILIFLGGELVIPETNSLRDEIKQTKINKRKSQRGYIKNDLFYITEDGNVLYFRSFDSKRNIGRDVVMQRYINGKLIERIDAKRMKWTGSAWRMLNVVRRAFSGTHESVDEYSQLDLDIAESPDDFARKTPEPEEMGFWELRRFIQKVQRSGIIPRREKTDLWMKFAYPLVNLIVLMLGIPLSLKIRKGSYIYGFGQSFFIAFIYLATLRAGQAFGYNAALPPILAAFLGNIIFFCIGIVLLWRMEKV